MKKIFALLFAALSVAFFACGDEKTDNGNDWFLAPAASATGCWRSSARDSPARS